jgi:hypothetical protein
VEGISKESSSRNNETLKKEVKGVKGKNAGNIPIKGK